MSWDHRCSSQGFGWPPWSSAPPLPGGLGSALGGAQAPAGVKPRTPPGLRGAAFQASSGATLSNLTLLSLGRLPRIFIGWGLRARDPATRVLPNSGLPTWLPSLGSL